MEHDRKGFQPVRVEMIGVESGLERFTKNGVTNLPTVSKWRNNLTALSQHENLFFIASGHCIAVYQPEFPYQTLRRVPSLLIYPELAAQRALGYLSHGIGGEDGHCINHVMVGDLGSQQILLFATDSGNVEAYYTSAIAETIRRNPGSASRGNSSDVLGLRPFFSQWVHQSAWGLAIHTEARMIAVSANTPNPHQPGLDEDEAAKVTVFAFALTADSSSESDGAAENGGELDADWTTWTSPSTSGQPKRDRNYRIVLAGMDGHENNIPNIQFADAPDKDGGIWLLSTDIDGHMKLWQVWKRTCFRTWFFDSPENSVRPWMTRSYPGWNVAALDVSSFRLALTNEEFVGVHRAPPYHGFQAKGESFNLSTTVARIPGNSTFHPSHPDSGDFEQTVARDEILDGDDYEEPDGEQRADDPMESVQPSNTTAHESRGPSFLGTERSQVEIESFNHPTQFDIETDDDDSDYNYDPSSGDESLEADVQVSPPPPLPRIARRTRRYVTPIQNPNVETPEIAMIHCSDSHIRLLGSPKQKFPHIFCASILRQLMPDYMTTHMQGLEFIHMDRLNMLHKIPELGVLLVATQTGRVAVCALTQRPDKLLGFRVDCVLPTKKQERQGRRPSLCPLIGMAVAPIQGRWKAYPEHGNGPPFEDGDVDGVHTSFDPQMVILRQPATPQERHAWSRHKASAPTAKIEYSPWTKVPEEAPSWLAIEPSRRYRIMLTYSDLSVLTYELWRDPEQQQPVKRTV